MIKKFIDEKGTFEIEIPFTWNYKIENGIVHTFNAYEEWIPDVFQISMFDINNEEEINKFLHISDTMPLIKIGDKEFYSKLEDVKNSKFYIQSFIKLFENKLVHFTFTYPKYSDKDMDNRTNEEKIQKIYSIIESFKFITGLKSIEEINTYRFNMFNLGVGEAALLLNKAVEEEEVIQMIYILVNQIDGMLRTAVILKTQIKNSNRDIEVEWMYQKTNEVKKSEKDILKKALELGIINKITFEELLKLYDEKDNVMPKIILSEITSTQLEELVFKYYQKKKTIVKILSQIEVENQNLKISNN